MNSSAIRLTRFLTPPPDGGFVRNDNINKFKMKGKQWRFAEQIATASLMQHKILSFRALARNRAECELTEGNLIISCFEFVIDNRYSNLVINEINRLSDNSKAFGRCIMSVSY